ncbi:hypothetical protein LWI28_010082 [Acer negundo]|uniref:Uncharacterized protein n=1 Tax=Acer negundo TaxID=4023 RepID=A0AAD5NSS3_ACENE|nr:hypothetical protein LWI28_010082 [Acer negundo]
MCATDDSSINLQSIDRSSKALVPKHSEYEEEEDGDGDGNKKRLEEEEEEEEEPEPESVTAKMQLEEKSEPEPEPELEPKSVTAKMETFGGRRGAGARAGKRDCKGGMKKLELEESEEEESELESVTSEIVCNIFCEILSYLYITIIVLAGSIWRTRRTGVQKRDRKDDMKHLEDEEEETEMKSVAAKMVVLYSVKLFHFFTFPLMFWHDAFGRGRGGGGGAGSGKRDCKDRMYYILLNSFISLHFHCCYGRKQLEEEEEEPESDQSTKVVDKVVVPLTSDSQMVPSQITLPPKRSEKNLRQLDRYLGIGKAHGVVYDDSVDDPLSFKHVMEDSNKEE